MACALPGRPEGPLPEGTVQPELQPEARLPRVWPWLLEPEEEEPFSGTEEMEGSAIFLDLCM